MTGASSRWRRVATLLLDLAALAALVASLGLIPWMRLGSPHVWLVGLLATRILLEEGAGVWARAPAWLVRRWLGPTRRDLGVLAASLIAGPAAAGAAAGAWALRFPRTDYPTAPVLVIGAIGLGLVLALTVAGLVSVAANLLTRWGLLRSRGSAPRLGFVMSGGGAVILGGAMNPVVRWSFPAEASAASALIAGCGLFMLLAAAGAGLAARPASWRERGMAIALLFVAGLVVASGTPAALPAGTAPEGWPEAVLLITIDTLRADHLGCYGYERNTSPQIDALAARSVLFERAFAPMPSTDPSHVALLTGLHPRSTGVMANGVPVTRPDTVTLASLFRDRGYRTGAITSRAHLNPDSLELSGFQTYSVPSGESKSTAAHEAVRRARRWLDRHGDAPFFLWVHFWDPHGPYDPPAEPERSMFVDEYRGPIVKRHRRGGPAKGEPYPQDHVRYAVGLYDGEIRYADERVGALISDVRGLRGEENVLVVLASDHGETFDEFDREYGYAYDHSKLLARHELHVPLMVSWPGRIPQGVRVATPVSLASLAPTLAALLGSELDVDAPPLDLGGGGDGRMPPAIVFAERKTLRTPSKPFLSVPEYAVIQGSWLLIENDRRGCFLYDMDRDPAGTTNLADRESAVVERLRARRLEFLLRHPMSRVEFEVLEGDRLEALRGLGYHGK